MVLMQDGRFVKVARISEIEGTPDLDAAEYLGKFVDTAIAVCDEAIERGCGFGKYSKHR